MKLTHSKNTIFTTIFKPVVKLATRQLHGKLSSSTISAIIVMWVFLLNDYSSIGLAPVSSLIAVGASIAVLTRWWDVLPGLTCMVVAANYFAYADKIDHQILYDLLPLFIWIIIRYQDAWLLFFWTAFYYATSGFAKLWHGWLSWETQRLENIMLYFHRALKIETPIGELMLSSGLPTALWEVMDYAAVLFELGWIIIMIIPRSVYFMVSGAVVFHLINYMMLGIGFWPMFPVYALLMACIHQNPWHK